MADGFKPILARLVEGQPLTSQQAHDFFAACLRGEPTPAQVAAAVTALRLRGETVDEIAGAATVMREFSYKVDVADRAHPFPDGPDNAAEGDSIVSGHAFQAERPLVQRALQSDAARAAQ